MTNGTHEAVDTASFSRAGCLLGQLAGDAFGIRVEFRDPGGIRGTYPAASVSSPTAAPGAPSPDNRRTIRRWRCPSRHPHEMPSSKPVRADAPEVVPHDPRYNSSPGSGDTSGTLSR